MSFDPLLTLLGLSAFASAADPVIYTPTAARAAIRIAPAVLPSTPGIGDLAVDSGDTYKLKWWNGSAWQTAGGGGGTPAGADTQIQFNNSGSFGASAKFTWTDSTGTLYINSSGPGTADAIDILLSPSSSDIGDGFYVAAIGSTTSVSVDTATTSGDAYGLSISAAASFGASGVVNDVIGVDSTALATTSLNSYVDDVGAFRATARLDNIIAGTLTVPRLFGLSVNASITASGSGAVAVTSAYGVEVRPVSLGANATISTWYGLYLGSITGGAVTNRYGVYQADAAATNYFAGKITLAGSTSGSISIKAAAVAGTPTDLTLPTTNGAAGNVLSTNGAGVLSWAAAGGTPAGSSGQVQFNNAGAFGAVADLTMPVLTNTTARGLVVANTLNLSADGTVYPLSVTAAVAPGSVVAASTVRAINVSLTSTDAANFRGSSVDSIYVNSEFSYTSAATVAFTTVRGLFSQVKLSKAAAAPTVSTTSLLGGQLEAVFQVDSGSATASNATGLSIGLSFIGAGTKTGTSARILNLTASEVGTVTYATKYGIYQSGATYLNYFEGSAGIGVLPDGTTRLSLNGATTAISAIRIGQSASVPAAPTNGDVWLTANNLFLRRNGGTQLLVEHATTTSTGQIPAWSTFNGTLGSATGLTWASGGGGQTLTWTAGTRTSSPVTGFTSSMTLNAAVGSGVTASFNASLTAGGNGAGSATAISTPLYSSLTANINTVVDTVGCRHVGVYAVVNSTPPSFGWATNSTFVGTLSRIAFTSATNDTNRPFYQMIGNDVELNMTLTGTSGVSGAIDSVIGLRVNPQTFSVLTTREATITNYYGLYLGTLTTSGTGLFTVSNRYGVYQADAAALNAFEGAARFGAVTLTNTAIALSSPSIKNQSYITTSLTAPTSGAAVFGRAEFTANSFVSMTGVYGMARNATAGDGTLYGLYADAQFVTAGGAGSSRAIGLGIKATSAVTTAGKFSYGITGTVTATGASNASSLYAVAMEAQAAASSTECYGAYFKAAVPAAFTGTNLAGLWIDVSMDAGTASTTASLVRGVDLRLTVNQGDVRGYTAIRAQVTETAVGSGDKRLLDLLVGINSQFYIDNVGNAKINTAGSGLFIKEGSNAKMGTATLVAGAVTVSTTAVGANSRIFISTNADGGTPGWVRVSARSAGASFTITSSDGADTSSVAWMIVDPA